MAFTVSNQQYVSGTVRLKLFKGHALTVGRKSPNSLYRHELATYEEGNQSERIRLCWLHQDPQAWARPPRPSTSS